MSLDLQREYDKIAISRMKKHNGGLNLHTALGNKYSIRIRWKLERLGLLKSEEGKNLSQLIDEIAINQTFSEVPIGVRYASVKREKTDVEIFSPLVSDII